MEIIWFGSLLQIVSQLQEEWLTRLQFERHSVQIPEAEHLRQFATKEEHIRQLPVKELVE